VSGLQILGDWGSTRLRLWRLRDGTVVDRCDGPGIGALRASPRETLQAVLAPWLAEAQPSRIVLCGMAGARNGLHEAGYVECPASLDDWRCGALQASFGGAALRIGAGVALRGSGDSADDVMRGEETQVYGAIRHMPELAEGRHVIVLPGTHSKWVWLQDGRITGLRTFLTGEMFALLSGSSLLAAGGVDEPGGEAQGFAAGLHRAVSHPGLLGQVFEARSAQLRRGRSASWAQGLLSGLLLGNEVAEMRQAGLLADRVHLIGDPQLIRRYEQAFAAFAVASQHSDGDECVFAGLGILNADD